MIHVALTKLLKLIASKIWLKTANLIQISVTKIIQKYVDLLQTRIVKWHLVVLFQKQPIAQLKIHKQIALTVIMLISVIGIPAINARIQILQELIVQLRIKMNQHVHITLLDVYSQLVDYAVQKLQVVVLQES